MDASIDLPVTIRREDVLHLLGYPEGRRPPERIEHALQAWVAEARTMVEGRGAFRHLRTGAASEVGLEAMDAAGLVIGLVTIGPRIEARVSAEMARGETTAALLLDAIGSAAVEEAADRLGAHIVGAGGRLGTTPAVSCRISPGYGGWLLNAQTRLFERLPHRRLGVRLLPSLLMVPRKSISFAMWIGADARPIAGLSGCTVCRLERCQYRRAAGESRR